jgi:hypothetical protein
VIARTPIADPLMDPGYNLEFCAPSTGLTKCDRRPRRIGKRDPSTGGEDELAMAISGPAHKYTRVQRPLFGIMRVIVVKVVMMLGPGRSG